MGIDAEMFVRLKRPVPDAEVRRLRLMLGKAFGAQQFYIIKNRPNASGEAPLDEVPYGDPRYGASHRHSIERVAVYTPDGIEPEPGETFLRVYPTTRFYGPGYERGDLPFLLMLARFLRDATGGEVWYGGDSGGAWAQPLDDAYERELWSHFVQSQHEPYRTDFGGEGIPRPLCALCGYAPMRFFGTGPGAKSAMATCNGCGTSIQTTDAGATWNLCGSDT